MLYRAFHSRPGAGPTEQGGAAYVARYRQGSGRHDNPGHYGAFYATRSQESAIAERIQRLRGLELTGSDLDTADGRRLALASFDDHRLLTLVDLDDPRELAHRRLRPSAVATGNGATTQGIALAIFREGLPGFSWWSTIEASWPNVTLFAERALRRIDLEGEPELLSTEHPAVRAAAEHLRIRLR